MSGENSRIHSLDGLRALSIALVILGHLGGTRGSPVPLFFENYAEFGVRVFFVISGYLITSILLREYEKTGTISLREFYIRRFFRIFPAAYVYITAACVFTAHELRRIDIVSAYGYWVDFNMRIPWVLGHLWSLSVEEQFYLLWPFLLLAFMRRSRTLAISGILLGPTARILFKVAGTRSNALGVYFPCVADTLATGCLLAMLQPEIERWGRWLDRPWFVAIPAAAFSVPWWPHLLPDRLGVPVYQLLGVTVMNFGIALGIIHCLRRRYALLNHPAVAWVGVLSYSLYLWQQPFIDRFSGAWFAAFPANILLASSCAMLSHYCVEKPFLCLRETYFSARSASPRTVLAAGDAGMSAAE
jgi:peptidoglycan/LPS O-acetylase OafA/YrhL